MLEPLLQGLKNRGMCFAPLRDHPEYVAWMRKPQEAVALKATSSPGGGAAASGGGAAVPGTKDALRR